MELSYDSIQSAFLGKITEYEFLQMPERNRTAMLNDIMYRAVVAFREVCEYDLSMRDDNRRVFTDDFDDGDTDELIEIISEGMVYQWMKQFRNSQDILQNALNTRDYSVFSPAEMTRRVGSALTDVRREYIAMIREYSYRHGDLTSLHM